MTSVFQELGFSSNSSLSVHSFNENAILSVPIGTRSGRLPSLCSADRVSALARGVLCYLQFRRQAVSELRTSGSSKASALAPPSKPDLNPSLCTSTKRSRRAWLISAKAAFVIVTGAKSLVDHSLLLI